MKEATFKYKNGELKQFTFNEDDYFYCESCKHINMIEDIFEANSDKCLKCGSKDLIHFEG